MDKLKKFNPKLFIPIYIIALVFIIGIFIKYYKYFQSIIEKVNFTLLLYSILFMSLSFLVMAFAWKSMLHWQKHENDSKIIFKYFFISQIVRYIPGNVWSIMARFYWHEKIGIKRKIIAYAFSVEIILMLITALAVSTLSLYPYARYISKYISSFGFLSLILLGFAVILYIVRKKLEKSFNLKQYLILSLIYFFYWLLFGISFVLICRAFSYNQDFLALIGINAFAWMIGYLSIVTPSGIGAREAVTVALLSALGINLAPAFLIAVTARIIFILAEVIDTVPLFFI